MLTEFFDSPLRIRQLREGPNGRFLEGFAQELSQAGYAEITARGHLRSAEHLCHWTGREGSRSALWTGDWWRISAIIWVDVTVRSRSHSETEAAEVHRFSETGTHYEASAFGSSKASNFFQR